MSSNIEALSRIGKSLLNSVIPPTEMARNLNEAYFTIVKSSDSYLDMSSSDQNEMDATFFILTDELLKLARTDNRIKHKEET